MTLFAGALLRTIEFVMVTTDASFPGPGERGGGSRELGSGADDARRGEGRGRRGAGRRRDRSPRDAARARALGGEAHGQAALDRGAGVTWCTPLSPWTVVQNWHGIHKPRACLLDGPPSWVSPAASSSLCPQAWGELWGRGGGGAGRLALLNDARKHQLFVCLTSG